MSQHASRRRVAAVVIALGVESVPGAALAQGFASTGQSGLLNVPSAEVLDEGRLEAWFGNRLDPLQATPPVDSPRQVGLGIGVFRGVELSGSVTEYSRGTDERGRNVGVRDIAAHLKWQLPLFASPDAPRIALGVQDAGGGAQYFHAPYAVLTHRIGPVRATVGVGSGRLDGPFGGLEVGLPFGFTALADHDTEAFAVGVRWRSEPIRTLGESRVLLTAAHQGSGRTEAAAARNHVLLALQVPLGPPVRSAPAAASTMRPLDDAGSGTVRRVDDATPRAPSPARTDAAAAPVPLRDAARTPAPTVLPEAAHAPAPVVTAAHPVDTTGAAPRHASLRLALVAAGLRDVMVGDDGSVLEMRVANASLPRSDVDAAGVAFALAARHAPPETSAFAVTVVRRDLPTIRLRVEARAWRDWLARDGSPEPTIEAWTGRDAPATTAWSLARRDTAAPAVEVRLVPYLRTFVANENAAFSYSGGVSIRGAVGLWRGAAVSAEVAVPLADSAEFEPGRPFEPYRRTGGLQSAMIHQAVRPHPAWLADTGVGIVERNWQGIAHESWIRPSAGWDLALRWRGGWFRDGDTHSHTREYGIATARTYLPRLDTFIEAGFGQFWDGDRGVTVEATRWFGDVSVQLYARDTGTAMAGVRLGIPLGGRRDAPSDRLQWRIAERFEHGLGTTLGGSANVLLPEAGRLPLLPWSLQAEMLDDGRASVAWLTASARRLREAAALVQ